MWIFRTWAWDWVWSLLSWCFYWSSLIRWWVNMGESGLMYSIVILDLAILFTVIQPLRMSEVWLHCAMRLTKDEWRPGEMGRVRTKWRFNSLGKSHINGACLMFSPNEKYGGFWFISLFFSMKYVCSPSNQSNDYIGEWMVMGYLLISSGHWRVCKLEAMAHSMI